jgi:uncharacterized OB-fold protein
MSQLQLKRISAMPDRLRVGDDADDVTLLGTRCRACSSAFLGAVRFCRRCTSDDLEAIELTPAGTLHSYTVVYRAGGTWSGPEPYALGEVLLPEGVLVASRIVDWDEGEQLELGSDYELTSEVVDHDEEGNEIIIYRWQSAATDGA